MCQCGCGKPFYSNELTDVRIEQALDASMRRTKTTRVIVSRRCKEPFEEELAMQKLLQLVVKRWIPKPKTPLQRLNVFGTFRTWLQRVGAAVEVMKTQHSIHQRTKGFEWARRQAIESAVLFGCPRFMQGFMSRRFLARAQRKRFRDALAAPIEAQA